MGRGIKGNTKAVEQLASTASYSHGWMDGWIPTWPKMRRGRGSGTEWIDGEAAR